jgi:hypothetical protein
VSANHPDAALALHGFIVERHLRDGVLVGPDSGVRLNYRAGRFVKSYTRFLPWRDDLCYLQAQGYWALANWRMSALHPRCGDLAVACAEGIVARQRPDGAWDYPNPEWKGRVATAEGTWAAIGLLETYRQTGDQEFLQAALRWHRYLDEEIGWMAAPGGQAIGYFAELQRPAVPNNSAMVLRLLAELSDTTQDERFLGRCKPVLGFLSTVQRPNGELPYQVDCDGTSGSPEHFQCFQYNAFQLLDLARYEALTGDRRAAGPVDGLARFLHRGVDPDGTIPYACGRPHPRVTYHLAAVGAALGEGARREVEGCATSGPAVLRRLLALQQPDGGFAHSRRDYGFLSDRRSYPRNLAMILFHLLSAPQLSSS